MNWDAIGAIGQAVSAFALIIVIVQVRHARSESRRALSQGRGEALRELMRTRATDPKLNGLYGKANVAFGGKPAPFLAVLMERGGMTLEDAASLNWDLFAWFMYRLQVIPNVDDLPPMERMAFDTAIRTMYGPPGVSRIFFEEWVRPTQHSDAVRYIDNLLAQPS